MYTLLYSIISVKGRLEFMIVREKGNEYKTNNRIYNIENMQISMNK